MLYDNISQDMINAMKNHDKDTLSTLRLLKSAIDLVKINNKLDRIASVSDEIVIEVVSKQVKTHKESIVEFQKGNRNDLVEGLEKEISILSAYLPEQLSEDEIRKEIDKAFDEIKPESVQDIGKVMKALTPIFKGKADMKLVNNIVRERLN